MHCKDLTTQVTFHPAITVPEASSVVDYSLGLKGVPNFLKEGRAINARIPSL